MNIDLLSKSKTEIYGEWYIAKPEPKPLWLRLKDAYDVICSKGVCVTFTENVDLSELIANKLQILINSHNKLQEAIKNCPTDVSKVVDTKLTRELHKLSVSFVGNDIKIKNYDLSLNKQKRLIISDGSKMLDAYDISDISKMYEDSKFKFVFNKTMDIFWENEKTITYMTTKENSDDAE